MTTTARAAICPGEGKEFHMAEVELDDLREDEIMIRVVATGICHTDMAVRDQQLPTPLPAVLGHEGAGIVEAVGDKVTVAKVGDRVIASFNSCGHCPSCDVDAPTYCYEFGAHNFSGRRADGSATITRDGEAVGGNFFGQSSFATHAIAHQRNVVRVPDSAADLPLERLAPLGCGLMTGAGAVLRSMDVREGLPIAVFGTGTVGLAAIMAAKIAGADPIIAVDMHESRVELARELGATHTVKAGDDAMDKLKAIAPQGLAYAFDTTGVKKVIEGAFEQIAPKGILGLVGASPPEDMLSLNEAALMGGGKRVIGILGGDSDVGSFICELIAYHQDGRFPFDRLIRYFDFDDINAGIEASESGEVVKPVLRISAE
ncbi:alcohol dehydrogenase catalytic domain-containing protein [Erythrobacter arachoides]|uniref:Alcohol dehydrogenase catalytic domain-containing protein n=1 Tax=Aurantiacibacter arachoides TaxID=1850444 RepID=A0A844ZVH1_9SPHN|nr:NAD(P)-dependent alcohol dehydrogenase [Aurantiacibacter arachoides]MXO92301.1 alcohol dehydrogenase catalytic domain-containing protein [Aurantiacibacter arachoides]GGD58229.1 aryl-alcohol dehydrogenase [Aurantiacibacter arachoides]